MGVTKFSIDLLERYVMPNFREGTLVYELGAQYLYNTEEHCNAAVSGKPVYAKKYFTDRGFGHTSIDLNGEADMLADLCEPLNIVTKAGIITDFGTAEHTDDLYMTLKNCHDLCDAGGFMIHENPKTGNWPVHGNWYFTVEFWESLIKANKYKKVVLGEHPAMGNDKDGWNVYAIFLKIHDTPFVSREVFDELKGFGLYNK